MQVQQSLEQAREWLAQGLLKECYEMLQSLEREFEQNKPEPSVQLDLYRGLLAVSLARGKSQDVNNYATRALQLGRELYDFESEVLGAILFESGNALADIGQGSEAETLLLQAYRRLPDDDGQHDVDALHLAQFYSRYGHFQQSLLWAKDALGRSPALDSGRRFLAQRTVASLLDVLSKSLEAIEQRQQAISSSDENPAYAMLDQARSQRRLGWAGKAIALYRESLHILPGPEKARVWRELALTQLSRRDLEGAASSLEEGLKAASEVSFEWHLLKAEKARLYQFQGQFAEAEQAMAEVLAPLAERFQAHHPLVLRLLEVTIELALVRREFSLAQERARELLKTSSTAYGEDHPSVARALYWLGLLWGLQGQREAAQQAFFQAQLIWDAWDDLPDLERSLIHYAAALIQVDKLEFFKAEEQMELAVRLIEQQGLGENAQILGHLLNARADIHRVTGRDRQAQQSAERAQLLLQPRR